MWCEQLPELPQPGQHDPASEDSVPAAPAPALAPAGLLLQGAAVAPAADAAAGVVLCSATSVPQPVVQSRRRPLLGPSPR